MTAGQGLPRHFVSPLAPERKHLETARHRAVLAPQHTQRLGEATRRSHVGPVVIQVDACTGSLFLAHLFLTAR